MEIKFKIKFSDVRRAVDVWYYTDALVKAKEPIWAREIPCWKALHPLLTDEEIQEQVHRRFPAGQYTSISFLGQELPKDDDEMRLFILSRAPWFWLAHEEKLLTGELSCDFSMFEHLENIEHTGFKEEMDLLLDSEKKKLKEM